MKRHMRRLAERGTSAVSTRAPLFPNQEGGVMSKDEFIRCARLSLQACGVELTREFEGVTLHRFSGHVARVSGAQWLHTLGVPMPMLQVLGRWSSLTILRHLQSAPLQTLPETAARALTQGNPAAQREAPWLLIPTPAAGDSGDTVAAEEASKGAWSPGECRRVVGTRSHGLASGRDVL